ncbi:hypothetical protein BHE74_00045461, partial [Ensete ventricosum]
YTPVKACLHKVAAAIEQRGTDWPEEWPKRLETFSEWLADSEDKLTKDHEHWKAIIDKSYLAGLGINWSNIRNVMDMKAMYGGCKQPIVIVVEMDRILRPGGWVIIRDKLEILNPLETILRSLHWDIRMTYGKDKEVLANYNRYPSFTLAATNRRHLLPSSSIVAAIASSSSLPLSLARPQQYTASIDVAASPTVFPAFCPLFHAALSLGRIIILPKGGLSPTTSVPPLLICCRPTFGSALPLLSLSLVGCRYPSPAYCRSALVPLPSLFLPFLPYRCLLVALPLHPLFSVMPSFPCISTTTAANCQIQCCPNSSPQSQPSLATIVAPLQSPPLLAVSPLLSALTAATCRQSLLPLVAASSLAATASLPRPFPTTPLLLHLLAATVATPCFHYCPHHLQPAFRYIGDSYTDNLVATKSYHIYDVNSCP